jgi:outer membrane protein TolC
MKRVIVTAGLMPVLAVAGCRPADGPSASYAASRPAETALVVPEESPVLSDSSTLEDYLAYAAIHNAGLKAAWYRWRAALERAPQVRSLPDPMISYDHFIRSVETRVGAQRARIGVRQVVPWPGKLILAGQVADKAAAAAHKRYEHARLTLFYRVRHAYYDYWYLARAIEINKANVDLAKRFEQVARTKYKAAAAGHPDVIRAQVELAKLQDRLAALRDLRNPASARLSAILNRPASSPLPWPRKAPSRVRLRESDEQAIAKLREANPELAALALEVERAEKAVRLARQSWAPNFSLGFDHVFTDELDGPMPTEDRGKDPVMVGVGISIPLWFGKHRAAVRQARARLSGARLSRRERENMLSARLKKVLFEIRDAERKIELYAGTLIPKGQQALRAAETAFKGGKVDFLDLIDAQRILLEFGLSHERALSSHAQRLAELEMLIGREVEAERPVRSSGADSAPAGRSADEGAGTKDKGGKP